MRQLLSLYGPFAIQTFGLFIVIGIILFTILFLRDPRRKPLISSEQYYNLLTKSIIAGFIGGRLLYALSNWQSLDSFWHIFAFWEGGYSLLGGILALIAIVPWYIMKMKIQILPLLDLVSIYAPLLQSVSRIGCFFAGCCYGLPLGTKSVFLPAACSHMHPTQLYSSFLLFLIFVFLYFLGSKLFNKEGQITCVYLMLMSSERFLVDFWRGDREFNLLSQALSIAQLIAGVLFVIGIGGLIYFTYFKTRKKS